MNTARPTRILTSIAALAVAGVLTGCTALGQTNGLSSAGTSTSISGAGGTAAITVAQATGENAAPQAGPTSYDAASATTVTRSSRVSTTGSTIPRSMS